MAFDWTNFLEVARFLQKAASDALSPPEAGYRAAIGRAYYAAFGYAHHYARAWLSFRSKARAEDKSQEHGALRAHLRARRRAETARQLDKLRTWRNRCDYEENLSDMTLAEVTSSAFKAAEYVIGSLTPPRSL